MNIILKMIHGSHLYGTSTENSDKDYKSIYIPELSDYLLQNVISCISNQNNNITKNTKDDIDEQIFSLNKFIDLCLKGDTYAIDMLHVNDDNILVTSDIWKDLRSKRDMFYTSNLYSYVGYLRQQAAKYSIKGSRLSDCEELVKCLNNHKQDDRLEDCLETIPKLEGLIIDYENKYIKIIDKIFQFRIKIKDIIQPLNNFIKQYGHRAIDAKNNMNIDWKAISHAFRSGHQLKEIYTKGDLKYPLKDKEFLLKVKMGEFHWVNDNISEKLDELLNELKELSIKSGFPEKPDIEYWNNWLLNTLRSYYGI